MRDLSGPTVAERPVVAFVAILVTAAAAYAAFQLAFDGEVNVLETAVFAAVFTAILIGLILLRDRIVE